MDKILINKEAVFTPEFIEVGIVDGNIITAKKFIPFEEKEKLALSYIALSNITNTEDMLMYDSYKSIVYKTVLLFAYYTNIDFGEIASQKDYFMAFDFVTKTKMRDALLNAVHDDLVIVDDVIEKMLCAVRKSYEKRNSLLFSVQKAFGSFIPDEDFAEVVAKIPDVNNQIVEMLQAYRTQKENDAKSSGHIVTPNGSVLNMAKRKGK